MEQFVMENAVVENVVLPAKKSRRDFKEHALSRLGETRINNYGSLMWIEEYNNSTDIWVRFKDGYLVNCNYQQFVTGSIKNPLDKSCYGVGYIGHGKYKISENGITTKAYRTWMCMLQRCYSPKFQEEKPTYKGCRVAEEWLNYQVFAKWHEENYYELDGHRSMEIDKDILHKSNKLYSKDTCIYTPKFINLLFVKRQKERGNLPIGVKECSRTKGKYEVRCCDNRGNRVYLGRFSTPEKGFQVYKEYKEKLIKDVAAEFKGKIPEKLYTAMMNYEVEIGD